MALLETYPVGTTVRVGVSSITYKIVHIGNPDPSLYDPSCDGIWMWQYSPMPSRRWNYQYNKSYASSEINEYMQAMSLGEELDKTIKWVKIPYAEGEASTVVYSGAEGLSAQWFLLSAREIGTDNSSVHIDGAKLDYFEEGNTETANVKRILNTSESNAIWWTRTPIRGNSTAVYDVLPSGSINAINCTNRCYVAPAFILPYNRILVNDDGTLTVKPPATLGELELKDKITFGKIYDAPIVWEIGDKNHAGYPANSVTLVTNQIIKLLCFDAKESANSNSDRRSYGNNRYIYSNLRQWLNSAAAAGAWYTAQHSADAAPTSGNVWSGYNAYDGLAGFLNAFTADERAALLDTTITVGKSSTDGGGTETCTDKIFPLSCTEVGLSGDHTCGSKLAIFSDNSSRIATVTAECVANSNYNSNPAANAAWYYWLRDAYAGSASRARSVNTDGTLGWINAYFGDGGLRPACNLSADTPIIPLADGTYAVAPTMPKATGDLPVGALVNAQFTDGTSKQCIAVNQGIPENSALYDASCNGTWMLFKECTEKRAWHSSNVNDYENSTIHAYLNGEFAGNLDGEFLKSVLQVKLPYRQNGGSGGTDQSGANGLLTQIFLLSGYEVGFTASMSSYLPVDGAALTYFEKGNGTSANSKRVTTFKGVTAYWWLRSPSAGNTTTVTLVGPDGGIYSSVCNKSTSVRPAFILPPDLPVDMQEDGSFNIVTNRSSARVIINGVETPAASSVIVSGVEKPCACSKIVNGVETPCI